MSGWDCAFRKLPRLYATKVWLSPRAGQPLGGLRHVRMGADDQIHALIGQPLGGLLLEIIHCMAAFHTPMAAYHQHIAIWTNIRDLLFDGSAVIQINDAGNQMRLGVGIPLVYWV